MNISETFWNIFINVWVLTRQPSEVLWEVLIFSRPPPLGGSFSKDPLYPLGLQDFENIKQFLGISLNQVAKMLDCWMAKICFYKFYQSTVVRGWEKNYLLMFENYTIFVLMKSSNISKNQGTGHFAKIIHFRCENSKIKFVV